MKNVNLSDIKMSVHMLARTFFESLHVTVIRALVEIQTIFIVTASGNLSAKIAMPFAFLVVELFIIKTLIGIIQKRDAAR
jgi:hypothetical protein